MKFKLIDTKNKPAHEGIMPMHKAPAIITWGTRGFLKASEEKTASADPVIIYREAPLYRIGAF